MEISPRDLLFSLIAASSLSSVIPRALSLCSSGVTRISGSESPLISTSATSGICSTLFDITSAANLLSCKNRRSPSSAIVMFMKKAGMSVALALTTFGRSSSLGSEATALSIFSFTSMNINFTSVPCSNSIKMEPDPLFASLRRSLRCEICLS